jgi:hypothetical protein
MLVCLNTAYWPNLIYLKTVFEADTVCIEQHEHYDKQSFRNRCEILSANGLLRLSIPVKKVSGKMKLKDVELCYREKWQHQHWKALTSAYKNSPYFEFFEDDIKYFYEREFQFLLEYNTAQLEFLLKALRVSKPITFTEKYLSLFTHGKDARHLTGAKSILQMDMAPYKQTFSEKYDFVPNLSSLDALFNVGIKTKELILN